MAMFMDVHDRVEGLTAAAVAEAHRQDLKTQEQYGVEFLRYWFDEDSGKVFCLAEAPDAESAIAVHRQAHGLLPDSITPVVEGS